MQFVSRISSIVIGLVFSVFAQAKNTETETIQFVPDKWEFTSGAVEFLEYKSHQAMKLVNGDFAIAKDIAFTNGTIEFDIEPYDPRFSFVYFRWESAQATESFYFRTQRAGNAMMDDAIQYAPYIHGINMWNMYPQYQSNAVFTNNSWNHVKLVIYGKQMKVYVNDMNTPCLVVPCLEADSETGTIAFSGRAIIANLVLKHNKTDDLMAEPGMDITENDPRYIRSWQCSQAISPEEGVHFNDSFYPTDSTEWFDICSERFGFVNLTRKFGYNGRRIVWLKTTIHSDKAQQKILRFGFNNEIWMYINDQPLYVDKNPYNSPMMKHPHGRLSLENSTITVLLKEGENELLIAVGNYFFGWGIIARLDDVAGVSFE